MYRACGRCRAAKVKCDFARPICGRCARRNTVCSDYTDDVFRDQSDVAEASVQRRQHATTSYTPSVLNVNVSGFEKPSSHPDAPWLKTDFVEHRHGRMMVDTDFRAVTHLFYNWTLYPCNHHISPGHLQDLPAMYEKSLPGSVLRLATEALAYADIPEEHIRARAKYGTALGRIRELVTDANENKKDSVLAALLVIDNFELMHKQRPEPLGPHSIGLFHILRARGDSQLLNRKGFSLWRVAHHRIQARQILLREMPHEEQRVWVAALSAEQPDLHITEHVFKISELCAEAAALLTSSNTLDGAVPQSIGDFLDKTSAAMTECQDWEVEVPQLWKPNKMSYRSRDNSLTLLPDACVYHDIWVAYMWNFHNASRMAMQEAQIDVLLRVLEGNLSPDGREHFQGLVRASQTTIQGLTLSLLETMPQLLGLIDIDETMWSSQMRHVSRSRRGMGLGGFFAMYALMVIHASKHVSQQHRQIVERLIEWIHYQNSRL